MMLTKRSIVIAEDNAVSRGVLTEVFREYGWRVRSTEDGFASLQALEEELPAVLLSDLEMPGRQPLTQTPLVERDSFATSHIAGLTGRSR
jgi:CheY-like chemotaxis protein